MKQHSILFVTQTAFHPPFQGDSARVAAFVDYFRRRRWHVAVAHLHDRSQLDADYDAMAAMCEELLIYRPSDDDLAGRNFGSLDEWCPAHFATSVANFCRHRNIDAILVQFVFLTRCFQELGADRAVVKILDADNVFTGRSELYRSAGLPYDWFSTDARQECEALQRADLILGIQEKEVLRLRTMAQDKPVMLIPHVRDTARADTPVNCNLLFAGAGNAENTSGLRKFVQVALPEILSTHPATRLLICGRVGQFLDDHPAIERLGVVPDLLPCFSRASIVINTTECGTGLKIKTVDALCHGKCLVSTPAGIDGLERYDGAYFTARSPSEFAQRIVWLFDNRACISSTGRAGFEFAHRYFNPDLVLGRLEREILKRVSAREPAYWANY